ncbi:MAG TPA: hypothetical protein VGJ28_16100 [Micromonosporaceae bacterium]|jgi:hypothetical protein
MTMETDLPDVQRQPLMKRFAQWLRRMADILAPPPPAPEPEPEPEAPELLPLLPPPPIGRLTERRWLQKPLLVPASGYVYTFKVNASFLWTGHDLERDVFASHIQAMMPFAVRDLAARVARRARNHLPHQAEALEVELQAMLSDAEVSKYVRHDDEITCRPSVWIELDDRVKQAIEPFWEQLIKLDCEHSLQKKRVANAEEISRQWLELITGLAGSPVADGAAQLTEEELSAVVKKIVEQRRAASDRYESLLKERLNNGDAFEQQETLEQLKKRLEREMEFPPPV